MNDAWNVAVIVVAAAVLTWWGMRYRHRASRRRADSRAAADVPVALDLLAGALRAGAPPSQAAGVVGAALGGPVGAVLSAVATELAGGASPEQAWACLSVIPGGTRVQRAVVRSADSGAALAGALTRMAQDCREASAAAAQASAARIGVAMALPLGLCFLPAFLVGAVVPVVVSVLDGVLSSR
jgi:pilus assembly protein TadC